MCSVDIPQGRIDMGYTICTNCSTEEKKVGHIIYPHKTGAYIQVVDKKTHENLNRLDRRGYKPKTARHYKEFKVEEEKPRPIRKPQDTSSIVHTSYDDALDKVMSYYEEWGYEPTLKYLRQLNSSGDIPLSTRVKIQDIVTDRYLQPTPRALARKFNKGVYNG
jgi:hypothetical protein|tara:strand:- start:795 stop:1283 length:489 start_codon:yes stop_codon:yes gene_type:complete